MKHIVGNTDIFLDPVTGQTIGKGGSTNDARFIVQTKNPYLPNAQALDELENGIMFKTANGEVVTHQRLVKDELPPLGGAIIKGTFRGNVWRGGKNGVVEESDALSNAIVDLGLLNTKLLIANFVMGSSLVPQVWQGATFLDKIKPGLLYNCAPLPDSIEKGCLRRAIPNREYMQPDLKQYKIWIGFSEDVHQYDPETVQITAPWRESTYITQTPDNAAPKSQALSELGIQANETGLIRVDEQGVIHKATLAHNTIWCGNEEGQPEARSAELADNEAKYILQKPNETLKNAQSLNELGINVQSLIFVTQEGVIKPAKLRFNHVWCGNSNDLPADRSLDFITHPKYILQSASDDLPNAQALNRLGIAGTSILKANSLGEIQKAVAGTDYATSETLEELTERAETAAGEAEASATEATTAAGEATGAATEASGSATAAAASAAGAVLSATGASISAGSASSSSSSASSSASDAKWYADKAGEKYEAFKATPLKFKGNVKGEGTPDQEIELKITKEFTLPVGTAQQRPADPVVGMLRCLVGEETPVLEYYNGAQWVKILAN